MATFKQFVTVYRSWLSQFSDLRDWAHDVDGDVMPALDNETMAFFRNDKDPFVYDGGNRIFRPRSLTSSQLGQHLVTMGPASMYIINKGGLSPSHRKRHGLDDRTILLMAADVDDKGTIGGADAYAAQLAAEFLDGEVYVERSRGGHGRTVYFLLNITKVPRWLVWEAMDNYAGMIQTTMGARSGWGLDRFVGLPTLWVRNPDDVWEVERRGTSLRLPYLPNEILDLESLKGLRPLSFWDINKRVRAWGESWLGGPGAEQPGAESKVGRGSFKGNMRSTSASRCVNVGEMDGFAKKIHCVTALLRETDGTCDLDGVLARYYRDYAPTGMSDRDVHRRSKRLRQVLRYFATTFMPSGWHGRASARLLAIVREVVPLQSLKTPRRDLITHERLADFVAVKLADAFQKSPADMLFAQTPRDNTLGYFKWAKRHGVLDWTCSTNSYAALLKIAEGHGLLRTYEDFVPPVRDAAGKRMMVQNPGVPFLEPSYGSARMIGPGPTLPIEQSRFLPLYREWSRRSSFRQAA